MLFVASLENPFQAEVIKVFISSYKSYTFHM